MLTLRAARGPDYYERPEFARDDYYAEGGEVRGAWAGRGAEALGRRAPATAAAAGGTARRGKRWRALRLAGLVPLNDAAQMLGMSRRTLERRIAAGEIAVFRDRRIVAIPATEIGRYVAAHVARAGSGGRRRSRSAPLMAPGERLWD